MPPGIVRFSSPTTKAKTGTFNFADTGVSLSLYSYAPMSNTETSDSIAR